jgi:hypothetical protein
LTRLQVYIYRHNKTQLLAAGFDQELIITSFLVNWITHI